MGSNNTQYINLLDLPDDIIQYIFYQSKPTQILKIRTVCVRWLNLSKNDYLWFLIHNKLFGCPNPDNIPFEKIVLDNVRQIRPMSAIKQGQWAIQTKNNVLLEKVLASNIDLNSNSNESPIYTASKSNNIDGVKLLLNYKYQIVSKKEDSDPLYVAAQEGNLEICRILLANGADIEIKFREGYRPIYVAAQRGRMSVVKYLYETGADIDMKCINGSTPLYIASQEGRTDAVKYILDKSKKSLDAPFKRGFSPTYVAARNGHASVIKILLDAGADLELADLEGSTPIYVAAQNGHTEAVQILLEVGANPDSYFLGGYTPLYIASQNGYPDIIGLLCKYKININHVAPNGPTAIYVASQNGFDECVDILLQNQADPHITYSDGYFCLYTACQKGHLDVIKVLLDYDLADINRTTLRGNTPLGVAIHQKRFHVVKYLCEKGADFHKTCMGKSPLQAAKTESSDEIIDYVHSLYDIWY